MWKRWLYLASFALVLGLAFAGGTKAADPNLVGWWPLNDGAGETVVDLSGSGTDGTIHNPSGGLGPDGSVWVEDPERGMVISFNGAANGAYVRAGTIPQMTLTNDFTWAFWAKQDAGQTGINDIIFGNRMNENAVDFVPRQFIKFTPTKFEWHMNGNGNDNMEYEDIPADVWLHHAVVKVGNQLTYYRNGIEGGSKTITQALDFPQPLFFGGDNEGAEGENWRGFLSDARIYNRALTKLEVQAIVAGVERIDMEVGFAVVPPVIDGEVDAIWSVASTQSFVPLADPADGSGTWKVLYDMENLYVLLDVTDDSLKNDSAASWQDDSVEVYFDGGNTKLSTPLSGDDHQYTFGWTADDVQGTNITGYTEGIEQAQVTTATGWRIEIKLPWLSIQGVAPLAGDLIGIDCYYNDDDDGGDSREGKMLSFSAVEGWNDASQWATAILGVPPTPVDPGTNGLVAYYPLDADAGDASGNGLDGVVMGDTTPTDGASGGAMLFDGDGDYIEVAHNTLLDITGPISLSLWIRPDAEDPEGKGTETAPMAKALSTASPSWSWQVRYGWGSPKPYMAFTFNTSPRAWAYVGQKLTQGEWHHIACSADGQTLTAYLNGLATESTPMGAITSSPTPVLIGSDGWSCDWIGAIDEVAIYNRALSAEEMLYLAGFRADTGGDPSLSIYYSFDEVGEIVPDESGNGNDGTVVGDVTGAAEGAVNGGAKFANGGYLDLDGPNVAAEDIPTSGMTLAAWIKCDNTGDHHALFNARASDQTWVVHPEARSNGEFRWLLRSYGGTTMFDIRAGAVTWGEWQHFAGTYDKASAKAAVCLNGEPVSEADVANAADIAGDWGMGARVGKNIDDARPFTGLMDEFRLYTRALSQEEIVELVAGM
ncbi:MAG TPA: sugar-binding protein [Sedimentisphaerales bacterium]|nr:sugar-binding protein [Sedimentisphaerales bacterium]HRS12839.1 sugar-binding protein [Sedimentisphaerales bacterium]HRV49436.1 sugar-binding protein [Sedimentisphaerales bacterium]